MPKDLTIENFQNGVGASPHIGFGEIRNLDVFSTPGIAKLNYNSVKVSGTTVTGLTNWIIKNPKTPTEFFALDSDGKVYRSTDSGDTWAFLSGNGTGVGQGLAIWKDYLFVARATSLDLWGALTTAQYASTTFTIASVADNTIQAAASTSIFQTQAVPVRVSSSTTLPAGLSANTTYYCRTAGSTLFRLYPTAADAAANTNQIDITDSGTGTHSILTWYWTLDWESSALDSDTSWHPMLVSKNDGKLYGGAGRYVFSIDENSGQTFAPATGASYTYTQQALDLPSDYRVKCLAELGENLMIGTWMGSSFGDIRVADIFTWNRSNPSFTTPIILEENGVNAMITINNILHIQAGIEGKIFMSNGVQTWLAVQIPEYISGQSYSSPGAIANYKGKLFIGMTYGRGVWSLTRNKNGYAFNFEHTVSSIGDVTDNSVGALCPVVYNSLLIGWRDVGTYGIDKTSITAKYTDYGGFIESPFYRVGTFHQKRQFMELEWQIAKELVTGQGIRIKYRTSLSDSYTTIGTYTYATVGGVASFVAPATIPPCEFVQLKIELTPGTLDTTTSPEVRAVILR